MFTATNGVLFLEKQSTKPEPTA